MLQKFLFVGLGGSGGATLRSLYAMISQELRAAGYQGGMPSAWQFVHIDVPLEPDRGAQASVDQLPRRSYVGLAQKDLTYLQLDRLLDRPQVSVAESLAGWRPDARQVSIDPQTGAGQYRAVGRVISAATMDRLVFPLRQAIGQLQSADTNAELDDVSRVFGAARDEVAAERPPQAMVVSSIAGGSGAGAVLDVCDVIRSLAPWGRSAVGLLYLPDVFDELNPGARSGVSANALATIAELCAGYWSDGQGTGREFALLESVGLTPPDQGARGPRFPLLVGRSNGTITFADQGEVYDSTARALTAWTLSPAIQDGVNVGVFGNWVQNAAGREDLTGITDREGLEPPFSSLGFASVGLGRDRFERYAAERLARQAVEQLLRGHWTEDVPRRRTPEEARDERAGGLYQRFLERSGLREIGPQHNQILDVLRGGEELTARELAVTELAAEIRTAINRPGEVEAAWVQLGVLNQLKDRRRRFLEAERRAAEERARDWCRTVQHRVVQETTRLLGDAGGPVTQAVLERTRTEIDNLLIPELEQQATAAARFAASNDDRIRSAFSSFGGKILSTNPIVERALAEGLEGLQADAEADLMRLCAGLVGDLADNVLAPLAEAVGRAWQALLGAEQGAPGRPSIVAGWPQRAVPESLHPAKNERLLEPVAGYPETLERLVSVTVGGRTELGAQATAVLEIVAGDVEDSSGSALTQIAEWVPGDAVLRTHGTPSSARYRLDLAPESLLTRATRWVSRTETAIGEHIRTPLRDYLDPDHINEPRLVEQRLDRFRAELSAAVEASRPLVEIDRGIAAEVHGIPPAGDEYVEVRSSFPFPVGHPARDIVRTQFSNLAEEQLDGLFDGQSDASRVVLATFLAQPAHAMVFGSLMRPIRGDWARRREVAASDFWVWRRTRPLAQFIPLPPGVTAAVMRGWLLARLLGWVDAKQPNREPVKLRAPDGWIEAPFPLLGRLIADTREQLPALLESTALALVQGPTALRFYAHLRLLGADGLERDDRREAIRTSIETWILHGQVPDGLTTPVSSLAGEPDSDPNDRIDAVLATLMRSREAYAELTSIRVDASNGPPRSRAWELRYDLVRAHDELVDRIEQLRAMPGGGGAL